MSQWLFKKTRTVVFVDSGSKEERARMCKPFSMLIDMDDEDENVFLRSIHERYEAHPDDLEDLCLADFVTRYNTAVDNAQRKNIIELKNCWKNEITSEGSSDENTQVSRNQLQILSQ